MDGFGLQVSFKPGEQPLINVRGATPSEFDLFLGHLLTKLPDIDRVRRELEDPVPVVTGLPLIQSELGGRVVQEYEAVPQSAPAPPVAPWDQQPAYQPQPVYASAPPAVPAPAAPVATYCDRCKKAPVCGQCGLPCKIPPKSVKNGQYYVHDCPTGNRDHKGQWCNEPN